MRRVQVRLEPTKASRGVGRRGQHLHSIDNLLRDLHAIWHVNGYYFANIGLRHHFGGTLAGAAVFPRRNKYEVLYAGANDGDS
jgi:hypothetical protein